MTQRKLPTHIKLNVHRGHSLTLSIDEQIRQHEQLIQAVKLLGDCRAVVFALLDTLKLDAEGDPANLPEDYPQLQDLQRRIDDFLGVDGPFPFKI